MQQTTQITVDGEFHAFQLDFDTHTWTAGPGFEEADFPLIAQIDGKRYELYSDGTFNEEET